VSGDGRKRVLALGSKGGGRTPVKREGREKLLVERREKAFSEIKQRLPADRSLALTHTLFHTSFFKQPHSHRTSLTSTSSHYPHHLQHPPKDQQIVTMVRRTCAISDLLSPVLVRFASSRE
jgi:hypothetical protein